MAAKTPEKNMKPKQRRGRHETPYASIGAYNRERLEEQIRELWRTSDWTQTEIAEKLGTNQSKVSLTVRGIQRKFIAATKDYRSNPTKSLEEMDEDAQRGFKDFAFFRERYLGRSLPAFQEGVVAEITEGDHDRILYLWPPTFGKTSFISVDYTLWQIVRDRNIRILILSKAEGLAKDILREIKWNLQYNEDLIEAYGEFFDEQVWRADAIIVAGRTKPLKDPTVASTSAGKHIVGRRADLLIVDDLCDGSNSALPEKREELSKWFHEEAETRIEPNTGICVVVGTRFSPHDLYGELKAAVLDTDNSPIWKTTIFRAHDDNKCVKDEDGNVVDHGGYPDGCLLWPERMGHDKLIRQRSSMGHSKFDFVYQQFDMPAEDAMCRREWIYGGVDPVNGEFKNGCLDQDRELWQNPEGAEGILLVGIDPSAEHWAAFTAWLYDRNTNIWHLVGAERRERLQSPQYTKIMNDFWELASQRLGRFVHEYTVESVGAFKFLLQDRDNKEWKQRVGAKVSPFETHMQNKYDPHFGVMSLGPEFEMGRVRIPYKGVETRMKVQPFIDEATLYPHGSTSDMLMSFWFPWHRQARLRSKTPTVIGGTPESNNGIVFGGINHGAYWNKGKRLVRTR